MPMKEGNNETAFAQMHLQVASGARMLNICQRGAKLRFCRFGRFVKGHTYIGSNVSNEQI